MKTSIYRRIHYHSAPFESANAQKENHSAHAFFGDNSPVSFFKPAGTFNPARSVQRKCADCEKEEKQVHRKTEEEEKVQKKGIRDEEDEPIQMKSLEDEEDEILPPVHVEVEGSKIENTTHNADCNGVSVSGSTQANYSSSASLSAQPTRASDCEGCPPANCVTVNANVVSKFSTAPAVTLPSVPGGLNACERRAVRAFINGTLNQHEQQHVAAFNTYRGTVRTPVSFTGCMADLQALVQTTHDGVEVPRRQASDAASALLDANGANVFNISCDCPDPET